MSSSISKTSILSASSIASLLAGAQKHLASAPSLTILGQVYNLTQIEAVLQPLETAAQQAAAAKTAWKDARSTLILSRAAAKVFVTTFRQAILVVFGNSASILADFGLTPPKVRAQTPLTHVVAAAKSLATRKARGTLGSKEKKSITGLVPATISIPVPGAMAAPTPSLAPAAGDAVMAAMHPAPATTTKS